MKRTIAVPREKEGSQPEFYDKGIVTFEVHHGGRMIYEYAKELGYHDQVVITGIQNVPWRERGPIARNLVAEFEHEDDSNEQSSYEGMYKEDEDDEEALEEAINVEDEGDEGTVLEGVNVEDECDDIAVDEGINEEVEGDCNDPVQNKLHSLSSKLRPPATAVDETGAKRTGSAPAS
ncbi:unnamed protein product [Prunus armeniaca]